MAAILRGIERQGTVLPKFADHKGRRHLVGGRGRGRSAGSGRGHGRSAWSWGPAVDMAAIKALRSQLWAEAAATPAAGSG